MKGRRLGVYQVVESEKLKKLCKKSVLSVPTPARLNASDGDEWFHFQGNSLPSWGAFSRQKAYPSAAEPYLIHVFEPSVEV